MNATLIRIGRGPLAIAAVALALLLPLAWLQYSWASRLAEAERVRMRAHLDAAADGFARDLNQQMGSTISALMVRGMPGMDAGEVAASISTRLAENGQEGWIAELYTAWTRPGGELELYAFDLSGAPPKRVEWPAGLLPLRIQVREVLQPSEPGSPMMMGARTAGGALLIPHAPLLSRRGPPEDRPNMPEMMPGMPMMPGMMRRMGMGGPRECWIAVLALDKLRQGFFPELMRRWFPREGDIDYEVAVSSGETMLFRSDESLATSFFEHPDVERRLMAPNPPRGPVRGAWTLQVRHRGAGLEQLAESSRRGNLALSFGVLLVLGLSIVAVAVAARRAQQLAQRQMEFTAGVSHELRTPLSVIVSAGDNLAAGAVSAPEQVKRYGGVIRDEGRRLAQMVEHVLGYARLGRGEDRLTLRPVAVRPLIDRTLELCAMDIQAAQAEVDVQTPAGLRPALADESALFQCLRNLVENALTHGGSGRYVGVRAEHHAGWIDIAVEDRGPGFDADERSELFEPFARGRRAHQEQKRGSGLGLALVKRLAEAQGGEVRAERVSAQGGARFVLRLPAATEEA